jgi:photosystem II stability/assembly factor-like uncharacterized protein
MMFIKPKFFCFVLMYGILIFPSCQSKIEADKNEPVKKQWEKLGPGGGGATFIPTFSFQSSEDFLIRCDMTGSYLTHNGGESYSQVNYANGASAYAFDPNNAATIYIGSTFLNRSTDAGKTWEQIFPKPSSITKEEYIGDHAEYNAETSDTLYNSKYHINAIRVDPVTPGGLYIGMGPELLYSSDAGNTWKKEILEESIISMYTNDSGAKNDLYLFTSNDIYIFNKTSHTLSRKRYHPSMSPVFSLTAGTLAKSDKMIMYALHHDTTKEISGEFGYSEVWKSEDTGNSWKRIMDTVITNQSSGINPSYSMISCAETDAANVYLVCNRYEQKNNDRLSYWYGALKTNNAGNSWKWVWKGGGGSGQYGVKDGIGVANLTDAWTEKAFGGEYIRLMDVGVYPADGNVAIVTDWYRTMKTMDGGKTWNQIYSDPKPDSAYTSRGLDVTTAYGVHFDPFDSNHIAISYTDIGYHHSFDRGKSWIRSASGVPVEWINTCYWLEFDPAVKGKIWSVWSGMHDIPRGKMTRNPEWKQKAQGGVCVSVDGGKSWRPTAEGMGYNSPATSIVIDKKSPAGNRTLYVTVYNKGVFKSTDDGKTWTLKNKGIEDNTCAFEITLAENGNLFLTVSATPMYRDGKKGREIYSGAVYRSKNGGETWTKLKVAEGLLFPNGIAVDPSNPDRLYLGCWATIDLSDLVGGDVTKATGGNEPVKMKGGIFMSEDGGNSWRTIFDDKQYVYDVTADEHHPGRLYCNTFNRAAYRSDDYGKTWKKIKGYDFHWGQRMIVDNNDPENIYITTFGSSVLHGNPSTE